MAAGAFTSYGECSDREVPFLCKFFLIVIYNPLPLSHRTSYQSLHLLPDILDLLQPLKHPLRFLLSHQFFQSSMKVHFLGETSPTILSRIDSVAEVEEKVEWNSHVCGEETARETRFVDLNAIHCQ